jgi:hypothetical protein
VQPIPADPCLVRNVVTDNNNFSGASGMFQFYAPDKQTNRSADSMHLIVNGNAFVARSGSSGSWPIGWGGGDNTTVTTFGTAQAFDAVHGNAWTNVSIEPGTPGAATGWAESHAVPLRATL